MQGLTLARLCVVHAMALTFKSSLEGFFSATFLKAESICQSRIQRLWLVLIVSECTSLDYMSLQLDL